jgi:hypothetical protein
VFSVVPGLELRLLFVFCAENRQIEIREAVIKGLTFYLKIFYIELGVLSSELEK